MKRFKMLAVIVGIFLCLSVANMAFATQLSVPGNDQLHDDWCWAACTQMILNYYGYYPSQDEISTQGSPACWYCYYYQTACDTCYYTPQPFSTVQYLLSYFSWPSQIGSSTQGYLSEAVAADEINSGRPFVIEWYLPYKSTPVNPQYHFLVAYGYNNNDGHFDIHDPWPDGDGGGDIYQTWSWTRNGNADPPYSYRDHIWDATLTINYTAPTPVSLDYEYKSGTNNTVTIEKGCEHPNIVELSVTATCLGYWWTDVRCGNWNSACDTGWILEGCSYTGNPCECQ